MIDPRTEALNPEKLAELPTDALLAMYADMDAIIEAWQVYQHSVKQTVELLMDENEATLAETEIDNGDGSTTNVIAEKQTKNIYSQGELAKAKEHATPEEWESVLTPEKPKPERTVDVRKFRKLAKKGKPFTGILEDATTQSAPFTKITIK